MSRTPFWEQPLRNGCRQHPRVLATINLKPSVSSISSSDQRASYLRLACSGLTSVGHVPAPAVPSCPEPPHPALQDLPSWGGTESKCTARLVGFQVPLVCSALQGQAQMSPAGVTKKGWQPCCDLGHSLVFRTLSKECRTGVPLVKCWHLYPASPVQQVYILVRTKAHPVWGPGGGHGGGGVAVVWRDADRGPLQWGWMSEP